MNKMSLIWDNVLHDLRSRDGRLSLITQATLVLFLLTLTLTSASVQQYLATNLDNMLGSDVVVETYDPLTPGEDAQLRQLAPGLSKTELVTITLTHQDKWERVQLKIVDSAYPLQGELMTATSPGSEHRVKHTGPREDEIWLGPRLATRLQVEVGDSIKMGSAQLLVTAILIHEPDRLMEGHSVALRAMVHADSVNRSELISSKRRIRHLIEADQSLEQRVENWTQVNMPAAQVIKKRGGQHPLASFWKRTENFLGLASVILFLMAAVAIDITNRRWLEQMQYRLSIYSSFGTPLRTGIAMASVQWVISFVATLIVGAGLAYAAQYLIIGELQAYFPGIHGGQHIAAALKTAALVFALLLALRAPALIQLGRSSMMTLIRTQQQRSYVWLRLFWGLASLSILTVAYSDNMLLTAFTLGAIGAALLLMIVLTWLVLKLGDMWGAGRAGFLPFTFFIMKQRIFAKSAQILGLGLCALLLLFTLMLMRDLGNVMVGHTRAHDGNLIIAEAQHDQIGAIEEWAEQTGSTIRQLRPFVSAQLLSVNDTAMKDWERPSDTLAVVQKPIRLSWADTMPNNNRLVGGTFWQDGTDDWQQISAESEIMTDLGLSYGDILTYQIEGEAYAFELVASHAYKPGNGSVTFWFQVPGTARPHITANTRYMGSMELPETAWPALADLWTQFPTLSLMPMKEITDRFDKTLAIVTKLTTGFAAMVLLLALLVLAASIYGFEADDKRKNGLLMSMGLRKNDCLKLNLYDWAITAMIAATGAIAGTWVAGSLIYQSSFGLTYAPDPMWVIGVVTLMVFVVCSVGLFYCQRSLRTSVRHLLNP